MSQDIIDKFILVKIINLFMDAIRHNKHAKIKSLNQKYPSIKSNTSYTIGCYIGIRECHTSISIENMLLNEYQHNSRFNVTLDTYKLLFNLGILEPTNALFVKNLIETCVCKETCERFFEIFDFFDIDVMANFATINREDEIDYYNSLISYSLIFPCMLSNYPDKYIMWFNKMLNAGCKMATHIHSDGIDMSDIVLLRIANYHYDEKTNRISYIDESIT
jgi:hypothetical protein